MNVLMYNGIVRINNAPAFAGGDHNVSQVDEAYLYTDAPGPVIQPFSVSVVLLLNTLGFNCLVKFS